MTDCGKECWLDEFHGDAEINEKTFYRFMRSYIMKPKNSPRMTKEIDSKTITSLQKHPYISLAQQYNLNKDLDSNANQRVDEVAQNDKLHSIAATNPNLKLTENYFDQKLNNEQTEGNKQNIVKSQISVQEETKLSDDDLATGRTYAFSQRLPIH